jgi:hypothetical protein
MQSGLSIFVTHANAINRTIWYEDVNNEKSYVPGHIEDGKDNCLAAGYSCAFNDSEFVMA